MSEKTRGGGDALVRVRSDGSCPFCGSQRTEIQNQYSAVFVMCCKCRACGPEAVSAGEAGESWARRVATTEAVEFCYLISDETGHLKIGVSRDPESRLASLQTANPRPLELIGLLPGGYCAESRLHDKYADRRISGEWFADCSEIRAEFNARDGASAEILSGLVRGCLGGLYPGLCRRYTHGDLAIASDIVRDAISRGGRQPSSLIKDWVSAGVVRRFPDKVTRQIRINGQRVRVYLFREPHATRLACAP